MKEKIKKVNNKNPKTVKTFKKVFNNTMKEINKIDKKRKSIYTMIILFIIAFCVIFGIFSLVNNIYLSTKYKEYQIKMENYGLNTLYNNQKANSAQKVTKAEAAKVVIGSILNKKDVSGLTGMSKTEYKNEDFVNFAINQGLISDKDLSKKTKDQKAKYVDTSILLVNTVEQILNKKLDESSTAKYKNINKYKEEDKSNILKAAQLEIYSKTKGYLINDKIYKGELNKMIITIVEKYATLYYKASQLDVSLVTDKTKMPSNYKDFPYIVNNITKEEYEMPFDIIAKDRYMDPNAEYKKRVDLYAQTDDKIATYFDTILNVDYKTINNEDFYNNIKDVLAYSYTNDSMNEYVKYVKDNKIKLKGTVKVLLPVIYNDGEFNRVRVKIEFKILNSKTNKNILLPDVFTGDNIKYTGKTFEFYADIQMGIVLQGSSLRVYIQSLPNDIIGNDIKIKRIVEK